MKKLPVALSLLAAATFCLTACDKDDDDTVPVQVPTTVTTTSAVPVPCVSVSKSASASPSVSVSVSVSPSDRVKNDVPGDGGVAYRPDARKAQRPLPEMSASATPGC